MIDAAAAAVTLLKARVEINGDAYILFRDGSKKTILSFRVQKETGERAGEIYFCRRHGDGRQECNCMDASCRKRICKHLVALHQLGAFPAPGEISNEQTAVARRAPDRNWFE